MRIKFPANTQIGRKYPGICFLMDSRNSPLPDLISKLSDSFTRQNCFVITYTISDPTEDDVTMLTSELQNLSTKYPAVDTGRLSVIGTYSGAHLAGLLLGQTDLFRCAALFGPKANLLGLPNWLPEQVEEAWSLSPLKYGASMKTPTLLLHSMIDPVIPFTESQQLYQVMLDNQVPSKMYLFHKQPDEFTSADISCCYHEIVNWFCDYLQIPKEV